MAGFWSLFFSSKPFEVQASSYEKSELELGDETFRLVKLNGKYAALYFDGASSKTFEIFSSKKAEEARNRFEMLQHKFPKLLSCSGEPVTSTLLKEVLDAIEKNPQFGITHLMVLIGTGECASNKSVIKQINDPTPDYGMSPLHLAIKLENIQVIRKLLDLGAKTSEVDSEGRTAYHYAANCVHSEIIEMLASKDISSIDKFSNMGETALHEACLNGLPSNVEKLLDAKANPSITKSFRYPIHCAIFLDNVEIVDMLCDGRPEQLELKESSIGNSVAHCFRSKEMLRCLKKHNVNLDAVNSLGETPLICKIKEGDFSCSLMLLVEAADASTSDLLGNSCLHLAIELDRPDLVQALLGFGANVNVVNKKGVTPRHKAAGSLGTNKDLILQYLHLVGAKRCQKSMKDCMIGCSHDSAYDGAPLTKGLTYDSTVFDYWLEVDVLNEALSRETSSRTVYGDSILTLDGGGMRGIATATILIALEKEANTPIYELFDVISGTSTGGILTMAIAYKKSLRYSISTYFRLKNEIFTGKRPYNQDILERYLKQEFGENSKMTDIEYPRVMLMSVLADRLPTELFMFKNFEVPGMHESYYSTDERFQPVPRPKDQLVWQAVRATTAATTYFRASGRFIDGAFIANNPTLDVLTELFRLNRINEVTQKIKPKPIYVVVSIGTGRPTPRQVEVCDFFRPEGLRDLGRVLSGFLGIGELLVDQVTQADGHIVRRAAAWCGMIGVPFYRFNPVISNYIPLDCTDDLILVKLMWETQCFINQNIGSIRRLAKYLLIKKEKKHNSAG